MCELSDTVQPVDIHVVYMIGCTQTRKWLRRCSQDDIMMETWQIRSCALLLNKADMKVIGPEGCEVLTIDRASAIPVYRQIYNDINERVQSGDFSLGSMLPSESRLSSQYGVERATVRRALALLVDEGKAEKIPGLGTTLIDRQETPGAVTPRTTKTMMFLLPRGRRDADRQRVLQCQTSGHHGG